jgi:hypothetical protein
MEQHQPADKLDMVVGGVLNLVDQVEVAEKELVDLAVVAAVVVFQEMALVIVLEKVFSMVERVA